MQWLEDTLNLNGRSFRARHCFDPDDDRSLDELYAKEAAQVHAQGDAWFVRRQAGARVPTGETLNGVPLYKDELVPSELWHIPKCSLQQSIELAIRYFDCPALKHSLHGEASRQAIWPFFENERLAGRAALSLVVYDAWLHFDLLPIAGRLTRDEAQRTMDFCLAQFKEGSGPKERAMLVRSAVETGTFGIGSV